MAGFATKLNEIMVRIYLTLKVKCLQRKPLMTSKKKCQILLPNWLVKHGETLMFTRQVRISMTKSMKQHPFNPLVFQLNTNMYASW